MNVVSDQDSDAGQRQRSGLPHRPRSRRSGWRALSAAVASAVAVVLLASSMPLAAAADADPSAGPPTSTPVSAPEPQVEGATSQSVQGAQGPGIFRSFSFVFLGRPGSVQAGFDRYYWMTAADLGVTTACTGSINPRGHCTWAEYYWRRTSTSGGSYLNGDNVPMYFDFNSATVWLIFDADAPVRSGAWTGTQAGGSATVAVTCTVRDEFRTDDWPSSDVHDDVWYDVKVCQGSLPDMLEQGGTASIPVAPDDFDIRVLPGSDPISRAGQHTELALELSRPTGAFIRRSVAEPIPVIAPVANAPVGGSVVAGPSLNAQIMCLAPPTEDLPAPGYSDVCMTDADGRILIRYLVPTNAASALERGQDTLSVFIDHDRDETHDYNPGQPGHEPAASLDIDIAKSISYVALGDSYSSGEAGRSDHSGFEGGAYQGENEDPTPTDRNNARCRRWNKAYPAVLNSQFLGGSNRNVKFETFACTGAVTFNIYDPADPRGVSIRLAELRTNRPSSAAAAKHLRRFRPGVPSGVITPDGWKPRQGVSLASEQGMSDVNMITLTIGGNDLGFGKVLNACVFFVTGAGCGEGDLALDIDEVGRRVRAVLTQVKATAPGASVFVLGYPYVTPTLDECDHLSPETVAVYEAARLREALTAIGVSQRCADAVTEFVQYVEGDDCQPLRANQIYHATPGFKGVLADIAAFVASETLNVEASEAVFLKNTADMLNSKIKDAAAEAGVHFVDVTSARSASGVMFDWGRHSPCNSAPWVQGYVADQEAPDGVNTGSFHPTLAGHQRYAEILENYIRAAARLPNAELSDAGLPSNPAREAIGISGSSQTASRKARTFAPTDGNANASEQPDRAEPGEGAPASAGSQPATSTGLLLVRRAAAGAGCGAEFVSAGEQVTLTARGFASGASVTFSTAGTSFGDATVPAPAIDAVTADGDGVAAARWMMPAAPTADVDPAPRAYAARATGTNPDGGTHTALMIEPLVAYPGTAPCAVADAVTTARGTPVRVAVLANDVAPTGGSLDTASVTVRDAPGGSFTVDSTTGVVTLTPDAGFHGTVSSSYVVYDQWSIGNRGQIAITVESGCTVTGAAGVTLIEGTDGDDVICVPDPDDHRAFHIIDGKGGDDTIIGGEGVEWIYGGEGADVIWGHGGEDRIVAGSGLDTIHGGTGMDHVYSLDTADTITDDDYELVLSPVATAAQSGPAPEDDWAWADVSETVEIDVLANDYDPNEDLDAATLRVTASPSSGVAAVVETAEGRRVVSYTAPAAAGSISFSYVVCDALGSCASAHVTVMVGTAGCTIVGTEGDDRLRGTSGDDVICGLGGNDHIVGLGGKDVIVGGAGHDLVYGGDPAGGADGADLIWGGPGDDLLLGGAGADRIWGGAGDDSLYGENGDDALVGGAGADTVSGGHSDDRLWGGDGDDRLYGFENDDTVWGGAGADVVWGGPGDDNLWGGAGDDELRGGPGADTIRAGSGNDEAAGQAGDDAVWGGPGNDMLWGNDGDDVIHGGPGADTIWGGPDNDRVWGGIDADTLDGGYGVDHLDGGGDTDACTRWSAVARCES